VALELRGLPAARPLALLLPRGRAAYLLTQYIPGAVNLHLFAWELARRTPAERRRAARRTATALGRLVGQLHAWGLAHRDLKGCNLMVVEDGERIQTPLVDLDGIEVRRQVRRRERIRNLARLSASLEMHGWVGRALRARFLHAYAREVGADRRERRRLWGDVARATTRLAVRRKRRNAAVG
jgi:tRNA A-37 threonylcarbamoyl transferase component Bud32